MKNLTAFLGMLAGVGLSCVSANAGSFKTDFNVDPTSSLNFAGSLWDGATTARTGSANWRNTGGAGPYGNTTNGPTAGVNNDGFLQLTFASAECGGPLSTHLVGGVLFNDFDNGATVGGFNFECDLRIGNGSPNPADGFSINYMRNNDPILTALGAGDTLPQMNNQVSPNGGRFSDNGNGGDVSLAEEGTTTGLSIGFDLWDSNAQTTPPGPGAVGQAASGITHDGIGLNIRVDGTLLVEVPMPNGTTQATSDEHGIALPSTDPAGTNAATDPRSLETGPNDGTGCDTPLKWVHFKADLATNGILNVYWKNQQILTNLQTSYQPSPGRWLMAARVSGNTANIEVDNVQITTLPATKPILAIGPATSTLTGGSITVYDAPPSVADTNTITLKLNGSPVTPNSVTKSTNGVTTISFDTAKLFASGQTNTVSLTIKDTQSPPQTATGDRIALVPAYATIPVAEALPPDSGDPDKPGFLVRPYSTKAGQPNKVIWTEQQLAGLEGPNLADLSGADTNGFYNVTNVINWDINTGASDGHFNAPDYPAVEQPGWPNSAGSTDNSSEEVLTYLSFPGAGLYTMGINSDDGFKVTTGLSPRDPFSAVLCGQFDGGRGSSDTLFSLYVPQAGVYPFRLIYENGGGEANCEWFTQTNGINQLINDATNAIKAYRALAVSATVPVTVTAVFPPPEVSGVPTGTNIVVQIADGSSAQLNPNSVQLVVNGAIQQVTIKKSGAVSTISGAPLPAGMVAAALSFADNSTPPKVVTGKWAFTVTGLTASMAATNIDITNPGFWVHPYQTTNTQPNSLAWTEDQLAGLHGPNVADLSKADASGFLTYTGVINWDIGGASAANGNFNEPIDPDTVQPGWILTPAGAAPNATEEVYAYLYFPAAGIYTMGVNSDDGFKVTAGNPLTGDNAMVLGSFDGARGAVDTLFTFPVASPGYYPFRLIYENGDGAASCEWFTQSAEGVNILINDPTNPNSLKAYLGPEPTPDVVVVPPTRPKFNPARLSNGVLTITWTGPGTLQQATNLTLQASDWSDVSPPPTSTTFTAPVTNGIPHTFYRLKQ